MTLSEFQESITAGIPETLPAPKPYDTTINHAPKRKDILTPEQKELALANALRYFDPRNARSRVCRGAQKVWANIYVSFSS